MLFSLALIILLALLLSEIMDRLGLPRLVGMLITGMALGPYALNLIAPEWLSLSQPIRQVALVVILLQAGLSLHVAELRRVGRPALLLCFLPATFEIIACTFLGPLLFPMTRLEGALLGAVLGAVSPAVIVPKMLHLMEAGLGRDQGIPQMILAGASVDDVFTIVVFTSLMGMMGGQTAALSGLLSIPPAILMGLFAGHVAGLILSWFFGRVHLRDTAKVLILLSAAFCLIALETAVETTLPLSGLLAVMVMGITLLGRRKKLSRRLSGKLAKIWVLAELLLFVFIGGAVDLSYAIHAGSKAALLLLFSLCARSVGVWRCLAKTKLTLKERAFCAIAYLPKATVQAAIGALPLIAGVPAGQTILAVAVLSILITAPVGAFLIDRTGKRWLTKAG